MNIRELYQELIIDHNRHPHNYREMDCADCQAQGFNPLCGDKLSLFLKIEDDVVVDVSFIGEGCAISTASASMMTDHLKGKTIDEARDAQAKFHQMLTIENCSVDKSLEKLEVLAGVIQLPSRVKCATLAWHTLTSALANQTDVACTE